MCLVREFTKAIVSLVVKSFLSGESQIHINPRLVKGASAWKQTIALILQGSGTCAECVTAVQQHLICLPDEECVCVGIWDFSHQTPYIPSQQCKYSNLWAV